MIPAQIGFGQVKDIYDNEGGDRIKVFIAGEDNFKQTDGGKKDVKPDDESLWKDAIPFMPKFFHVKPKVGEWVFIVSSQNTNYYMGPIIAQKDDMYFCGDGEYDKFLTGGLSQKNSYNEVVEPNAEGTYTVSKPYGFGKDDEISLDGRKNASVTLRDNDAILSSGVRKFTPNNEHPFSINQDGDQAFIDLKYEDDKDSTEYGYKSTATINADKIFLIGNKTRYDKWDPNIKLINKNGDILEKDKTDDSDHVDEIYNATSPLPYGDKLVEFLELFRDAFKEHVHWLKTPMLKDESANVVKLLDYDLGSLLSDNVKIN